MTKKFDVMNDVVKFFQWVFSRMAFTALLLILLAHHLIDRQKLEVKEINYLRPDMKLLRVYTETANGALGRRDLEDFISYYTRIHEFFPDRSDAAGLLAFFHDKKGQPSLAGALYKRAAAIEPHCFWFPYNIGMIYFRQGNYPLAAAYFKKAVALDPKLTLIYFQSSMLFKEVMAGEGLDPARVQERLLEGYSDAFRFLISIDYSAGDFVQVLNTSVMAKKNSPIHQDFFDFYIGLAAYKLGEYSKAFYVFQEILKKYPGNAAAVYQTGLCLEAMGQSEQAEQFFSLGKNLEGEKEIPFMTAEDAQVRIF